MEHAGIESLSGVLERDLTDPSEGGHPLQTLVADAHQAAVDRWPCPRRLLRLAPFEARATGRHRYLCPRRRMLDTLPRLLGAVALDPPDDVLLVAPGPVLPDPGGRPAHELALLRLGCVPVGSVELGWMIQAVVRRLLPKPPYRLLPGQEQGLSHAMRIETRAAGGWTGVGTGGLVDAALLRRAGLAPERHGAMVVCLRLERVAAVAAEVVWVPDRELAGTG